MDTWICRVCYLNITYYLLAATPHQNILCVCSLRLLCTWQAIPCIALNAWRAHLTSSTNSVHMKRRYSTLTNVLIRLLNVLLIVKFLFWTVCYDPLVDWWLVSCITMETFNVEWDLWLCSVAWRELGGERPWPILRNVLAFVPKDQGEPWFLYFVKKADTRTGRLIFEHGSDAVPNRLKCLACWKGRVSFR